MRIKIKNTKVFTANTDCKYHWRKLPKLIRVMRNKRLSFKLGVDLQCTDLRDVDLRSVYLRGAYLQYANLRCADLRDADLRGAYLRGVDLRDAYLQGAYLWGADLRGANLRGANLRDAYLQCADLRGADLRDAYLQGAYLQCAYLRGTDLRGAYLQGADNEKIKIVDFMSVSGIGSAERQTLFFKTNKDVVVQCGCFYGTLKEFQKTVKETHKGNKYEKDYLAAIKLVKVKFEL